MYDIVLTVTKQTTLEKVSMKTYSRHNIYTYIPQYKRTYVKRLFITKIYRNVLLEVLTHH